MASKPMLCRVPVVLAARVAEPDDQFEHALGRLRSRIERAPHSSFSFRSGLMTSG